MYRKCNYQIEFFTNSISYFHLIEFTHFHQYFNTNKPHCKYLKTFHQLIELFFYIHKTKRSRILLSPQHQHQHQQCCRCFHSIFRTVCKLQFSLSVFRFLSFVYRCSIFFDNRLFPVRHLGTQCHLDGRARRVNRIESIRCAARQIVTLFVRYHWPHPLGGGSDRGYSCNSSHEDQAPPPCLFSSRTDNSSLSRGIVTFCII